MKSCIQTFDAAVKELLFYLDSTEDEAALITLLLERVEVLKDKERSLISSIKAAHVGRKQYIYSVAIISMYGLLERFVDSLIEAYVHRISKAAKNYNELPPAILKGHTQYSLELLKAIDEDRHRSAMNQADVIENLHLCLSGAANFKLNGAAFALHRGNIYINKIGEFLTSVGIDAHLRRVSLTPVMLNCFQEIYPDRDIRSVADQELPRLFSVIDDLVDRRNEISHGALTVDAIESVDILKSHCRFLSAYVHALYNVVAQQLIKYQVDSSAIRSFGKPIAVYNNSIVCLEINNARISVGDIMAARTSNSMEPFRYGTIDSLQIDGIAHKEIVATEAVNFGAKVSFKASDQHDYFVFSDETF